MEKKYKIYGYVFAIFLLGFLSPIDAQWERQTPLPFPPFDGDDVAFANSSRGYIVGDQTGGEFSPPGRMLETTDGGASWHTIDLNTNGEDMNSVCFFDSNHGWVVGNIGYKTTDGGNTWTQMNNLPGGTHYYVNFITQNFGWTVSNGGLSTTSDGGDSWVNHGYNNGNLNAGAFLDETTGLGWTDYDLKKTTDGGSSWTTVYSGFAMPVAYILDSSNAVMVEETEIYYSNDGWQTWTLAYTGSWPSWANMTGIILTKNDMILYNNQGDLLYTTDAGVTWSSSSVSAGSYSHLKIDSTSALLFSIGGSVFKTTDGGITWNTVFIGSGLPIWGSGIRGAGEFWAVGNDGVIMKSTNSGADWEYFSNGIAGTFLDIKFFNDNAGLAGGLNGSTMKTTDAGLNWDPKLVGGDIQRVFTLDDQHAYVCGTNTVAKTTDQATTWSFMTNPAGSNVTHSDVFFVSPLEGWLCSQYWYGAIWHTTDGGDSWAQRYYDQGHPIQSLHMFDENLGYAVGPGDGVMKTTDGWQTNQWLSFSTNAPGLIYDIEFVDTSTAWIVGEHGYIAYTTDGCQTFTEQTFTGGDFNNDVKDIELISATEAYAVTDEGDILHTTDAGTTWTVTNISGPITSQWEALEITPSGMWVSGGEVWYNSQISGPMTLLPVDLISFTSFCKDDQNNLQWEVAKEINFDHYEVQTSKDGQQWSRISSVSGNNIGTAQSYNYTDKRKSIVGNQLYRLKMVDIDGRYEYSKIVRSKCLDRNRQVEIYPNPVIQGHHLHLTNDENVNSLRLFNAAGSLVMEGRQKDLNTTDLQQGVYFLQIIEVDQSSMKKLIVR